MIETLIRKTLLRCTAGRSNKFYEVRTYIHTPTHEEFQNGVGTYWRTTARWGACRGSWATTGGQTKLYDRSICSASASIEHTGRVRSKVDKGYRIIEETTPMPPRPPAPRKKAPPPPPKTKQEKKSDMVVSLMNARRF